MRKFTNTGKIALALVAIGGLASSVVAAHADITTGLVAQWTMNQSSGTTVANSAPGGNPADSATIYNTLFATWVPGHGGGYALQLNNTGNPGSATAFLSVAGSTDLAISGAYTVSGWFNLDYVPPSANGNGNPGMVNTRMGGNYFDIQIENGSSTTATYSPGLHADIGAGGGTWLDTGANAAYNFYPHTWYMVTYAVQPDQAGIYVNGSLVTTVTWTSASDPVLLDSTASPALNIGQGAQGGTTGALGGAVSDFNVYSRALTSSDVAQLYTSEVPEPSALILLAMGALGILLLPGKHRTVHELLITRPSAVAASNS